MSIFEKHRKACIISGVAVAVALFAQYLYAMFLPGVWYGDTFLYYEIDGIYFGHEMYGYYTRVDYVMDINKTDSGEKIAFYVNDTEREYEIIHNPDERERSVKILENGEPVFDGKAVKMGNEYILLDDNYDMADDIRVYADTDIPDEEDLFPSYTWLYNRAVEKGYDTRGEPAMLLLILFGAAMLFVDIKFPDLFWVLEHRLEVDGGEPSDWYRAGQKFGRVVIVVGIIACMIMTFTIH